jgi:hypothetical protein
MAEIVNFHYLLLNKIEKDALTALQKLSPDIKQYSKDEILGILFYNYRIINSTPKGLRLTSFGSKIMSKHFQSYKYSIDDKINNLVLVSLDKAMKWPYYLGTKSNHVIFYSEEDAAWFRLNGNNIKNYVESI